MIGEIRTLDPKPGRAFGGAPIQSVVPDVYVRAAPDGSWLIDLNTDVLPRVLVNQTYHARVSRKPASEADKSFVANCLQTANWLTRASNSGPAPSSRCRAKSCASRTPSSAAAWNTCGR